MATYEQRAAAKFDAGSPRIIGEQEADTFRYTMRLFSELQIYRNVHAGQWEEAALLIEPNSRNTFFYGNYNWPGQKKTDQQVDASGGLALHRFGAIADSLVTPRNIKWHALEADDEYVMKDRDTRLWFEKTTTKVFRHRYAMLANFSANNRACWQSIGAFGNATMFVDKFDSHLRPGYKGLRYHACPLGETFFLVNHQGIVEGMVRWFRMKAYQMVEKFGMKWLPATLLPAYVNSSHTDFNMLHCVLPRELGDYDPERLDERGKPYRSYYVSIEGSCLMGPEGGFRTFPFSVRRYIVAPGESYGRGPAQIVLPGLKTLNAEKKVFLKQGHRASDPILLIHDDSILGDLTPGARNYGGVTSDGKPLVHTLPAGDIQISEKMMGEERSIIEDTFLVSLFKVLTENPNMTATQVIELVNEKGMLVAPTMGGQHDEMQFMIERELDLLAEMKELDPMPPRLREAGGHYRVKDTSPLAMMRDMGEITGFIRSLETSKEVVNITGDPSYLDWANLDEAMPEIARRQMTPERFIRSDRDIQQVRKARAKQQQQQQAIDALPKQAAMLKAQKAVNSEQPGVAPGQQGAGGPVPQGA